MDECPECGHAVARHDQDGCLMFVVKHDGEAACPCWTPGPFRAGGAL